MSKPFVFLSKSGKEKRLAAAKKRQRCESDGGEDILEPSVSNANLEIGGQSSAQPRVPADLQADEGDGCPCEHFCPLPDSPIEEISCERSPIFNSDSEEGEDEPVFLPSLEMPIGNDPSHVAPVEGGPVRCDADPCSSVTTFLTDWAFEAGVTHQQLSLLARGLRSTHPQCFLNLHIDARTYFKTPSHKTDYREMKALNSDIPGKYIHIGMVEQITTLIPFLPITLKELIFFFNIDGLNMVKHCNDCCWPILIRLIAAGIKCKVMPIALYYGVNKPASNEEFLREFINELTDLTKNGLKVKGETYKIIVGGFACDGPAKALLLGNVYPNGYFSCTRCVIEGEDIEIISVRGETVKKVHKRVFNQVNCDARTDLEFRNRVDTSYRPIGRDTPLLEIPGLDFVHSMSLDYQHLTLHGGMKFFLTVWFDNESKFKVGVQMKRKVSKGTVEYSADLPYEFAGQKPRRIEVLAHYKATECRTWLLYLGPILLKDVLQPDHYNHFIMFHLAMLILVSPKHCANPDQLDYAEQLLRSFVTAVPALYTLSFMTHMMHNLIHLPDDIRFFRKIIPYCTADTVSTFAFENFMQELKGQARGYPKKIEQCGRRIAEGFQNESVQEKRVTIVTEDVTLGGIHNRGPLLESCQSPQYTWIIYPSFKLTTASPANSCCGFENGEIMRIENFAFSEDLNCKVVIGRLFVGFSDLYSTVCSSSLYGIHRASKLSSLVKRATAKIACKYVCLNDCNGKGFILFPLLHTVTE